MSTLQKIILGLILLTFIYSGSAFSQTDTEQLIAANLYSRTLKALQNYVEDEMSYFEGYLLCTRYPEKMKLLQNIDQTVEIIDTFSDKRDIKEDSLINFWKSQAHFYHGIALGLLGEKVLADFELNLAQKYFLDNSEGWNNLLNGEISVGEAKNRLKNYEELYLNHVDDLAPVQVVVDETKFAEIGNTLGIKQLELGTVSHTNLIPYVVAYSEEKLTNAILSGATTTTLYLPKGKFQIYNPDKARLLSEFNVKNVNETKVVNLPQTRIKYGFYYLILGSAIVIGLGL
ncbi:hypothetical protein JXJ21_23205 [candidate division KSB1 bacterium]|nr:hypothetical protein [candidate division KSB1 bacterium]